MQSAPQQAALSQFNTVTSIKKITAEVLAPIVKKIEGHVNVILQQGERFRQDNARLKNVADFQQELNQKLFEQQRTVDNLRDEVRRLKQTEEFLKAQIQRNKEVTVQDLTELRKDMAKKQAKIEGLNKEKQQMKEGMDGIKETFRREFQQVQNKLSDVSNTTQIKCTMLENKSEEFQRRLEQSEDITKEQRIKSLESQKKLGLYLTERESINRKMGELYSHIYGHVSKEEFEKYKKYQTIEIKMGLQQMQQMVDAALTPDVRKFLPTVIDNVHQLKKVNKLEQQQAKMDKLISQHIINLQNVSKATQQLKYSIQSVESHSKSNYQSIAERISTESKDLVSMVNLKLDKIQKQRILEKVDDMKQDIHLKITEQTDLFQGKLRNVVQEKKNQIFDAVRAMIPQQQVDFFNTMRNFVPKMEQIRDTVQKRCDYIEGLAVGLQETLDRFSNRITKIKTDLDLKTQSAITDIKYLQKNRQQNKQNFLKVGKSLAAQAEIITILVTFILNQEAGKRKNPPSANQVFVSFFDGLIYELKPQQIEESIVYRKKTINRFDFLKAVLTCFLTYVDSIFSQEFLGWKINKPSGLFRTNIVDQIQHDKIKGQIGRDVNLMSKNSVTITPLDNIQRQDKSMTINVEKQTLQPVFNRTTDGLKKIVATNKSKNKDRYQQDSGSTTARIRSRNRGFSQL